MTEERAEYAAGTPGPIDPTNHDRLLNIYWSALRDENDGIVYGSGLLAVARAVCPAHHAVFDTRTHVAVPVAEIERLKQLVIDAGDALENGGSAWNVVHDLYQPEWGCLDFSIPTTTEEAR